jgi:flagellar hook-associated protein 1 FlgK
VIGVDFSQGLASVVSQLNTKLNGKVLFANPGGTTLRVLDDGLPNLCDVTAASATRTVTGLSGGSVAMAFFVDATSPYSGALTGTGPQSLGFAGRIAVNPALVGDPSKLVLYSATTSAGDPARPDFIYQRLASTSLAFSPRSGLGTAATPFVGTLPTLLRQVLSQQGDAASSAASLSEGQTIVVNNLKQRVADQANVNVDQEMANLMTLQTAYGANARVMSAIKDMLEYLMEM